MTDLSEWQEYPATRAMYDTMRDDILANANAAGISGEKIEVLELGVEEMLTNIISYAYTEAGNVWIRVIRRFFMIMLLMSLFSAAVCQFFFQVLSANGGSSLAPAELFQMFLEILPRNFFVHFVEGNILQIVFIAILTGVSILTLTNVIPNLKVLIGEMNKLISKMLDIVSKVIYAAIFLNVFKTVAGNNMETIFAVWRIVAANYVFTIGFGVLMHIAYKYKINLVEFLRQGANVFLISFSTASNTVSIMMPICRYRCFRCS